MNPIVYLSEQDITSALDSTIGLNVREGYADAYDQITVLHAHLQNEEWYSAGERIPASFIPTQNDTNLDEEVRNRTPLLGEDDNSNYRLLIFLAVDRSSNTHKCYLIKSNNEIIACDVRLIPEKSDLYSRSKGLLETDLLASKCVGIVGLGSGGSPVAVELAKAGVGRFVLIDFDRIELGNLSRHICGINDLGRLKTLAVKSAILQKNPHASVATLEIDVNRNPGECSSSLAGVDLIICASDNDRSRFLLNEISLRHKIPSIFGRAITRATGGDVLRVRPFAGPCYNCLYSQNIRGSGGDDEEISQTSQAKRLLPDYTSEEDAQAAVQVGLSSDIMPISNFMIKLALVELSRGLNSGIRSLEDDLVADFYIWANRRDAVYENWSKLEFNFNKPSILRWYGARVNRDPNCLVCG
jgi:molybdopterin-synthase adenylyltransferase